MENMEKILDILKEIPEEKIPLEFEKTLSLKLRQEARAMKKKKATKMMAVLVASFLVVFGSVSVYNDLGGNKGDDAMDAMEMASENNLVESKVYAEVDEGFSYDMAGGEARANIGSEYIALLDEYFEGKAYHIENFHQEDNGDLIFYISYNGEELVFIGRSGEIYEQEGEEQNTSSD